MRGKKWIGGKTIFLRVSLLKYLIAFFILAWLFPQNIVATQEVSITKEFNIKGKDRKVIEFEVTTTGKIDVRAEWSGKALALILNGPGRKGYYKRKDGRSPLSLDYFVDKRTHNLGKMWKISVVSFNYETNVKGKVEISYPGRGTTSKMKDKTQVQSSSVSKDEKLSGKLRKEKKFVKIKYYEVQESKGCTRKELREIKSKLQVQKIEDTKTRFEKRIKKIAPGNPLAKIVIPLLFQRIEEKSQRPLIINRINTSPHLQTIVKAYKKLSPSITRKYFHPRYAKLKPKQGINKLKLGIDILSAVRPNYKKEIRQLVMKVISPESPKFEWNSAKKRIKVPFKYKKRISKVQINQLNFKISAIKKNPSPANWTRLRDFAHTQGVDIKSIPKTNKIHDFIRAKLHPSRPNWVPNLNNDNLIHNYYRYKIELDWFYCIDQNERTCIWIPFFGLICSDDEPYWNLGTVVPRYDPNDPDNLHKIHEGKLYKVSSRLTSTYDDVNNGENRRFRSGHRLLMNRNTFGTSTTFTIDLWEEDWTKGEVREALQDVFEDLRNDLINSIKEAVLDALKDALFSSLREILPDELFGVLSDFFEGKVDFASFLDSVQAVMGGIDIGMIVLDMIFSGKSISDIITGLGGACPEITIALLAIKIAGPIVIDLIQGDFQDALKGLLYLPIKLLEYIYEFFTDIVDFFINIMKIIDPDDHIQTRKVTIKRSVKDIFRDAKWGDSFLRAGARIPDNCGPNSYNSSFIKDGRLAQPMLNFRGADAKYKVYYNVKRTLVGGRETFGFTVQPGSAQTRTYIAKSYKKIKVSYCVLNTDVKQFILINLSGPAGGDSNLGKDSPMFFVDGRRGDNYELSILNLTKKTLYGYVTIEQK